MQVIFCKIFYLRENVHASVYGLKLLLSSFAHTAYEQVALVISKEINQLQLQKYLYTYQVWDLHQSCLKKYTPADINQKV